MPEDRINNIAGPPVEGKDFFGRKTEIKNTLEQLQDHDVLLLGPRRIGKTSLARKVMAEVRLKKWRAVEVNVAQCNDERGFFEKFNTDLSAELSPGTGRVKSFAGKLINKFPKLETIKVEVPDTAAVEATLSDRNTRAWTETANDLLGRINRIKEPVLIYMDELPIFLKKIAPDNSPSGRQRMRQFMDWFRYEARNRSDSPSVRWLVSGSIGLDTLVQQHEMSDTLHGFSQPILNAFNEKEAVALLCGLASSYTVSLSEDEAREIAAAIGWPQPYYLQYFFSEIRSRRQTRAETGISVLIEETMNRMIQPDVDNDFHHWQQRLEQQLSRDEAHHCLKLLNRTARDPLGGRAETLLAELHGWMPHADAEEARRGFTRLRDILVRDAYWLADDSSGERRYRFRLEPLRRWWVRRDTL